MIFPRLLLVGLNFNFNFNSNLFPGASGSLRHGLHAPDRERCAAGLFFGQAVLRRSRDGQRRRSVSFPALSLSVLEHHPALGHLVAFGVLPVHGPASLLVWRSTIFFCVHAFFYSFRGVSELVCASVCLASQLLHRTLGPHMSCRVFVCGFKFLSRVFLPFKELYMA